MTATPRRRAAALEALASPVRQELMSHLGDGPASVRDLAQRLGRSRQSLYYHVLALERAGLVRRVGTRGEGRAAERLYAVAAKAAGGGARALSARERHATSRATAAMLRLTQREIASAMQEGSGPPGTRGSPLVAVRAKARLDAAALGRARALLDELIGVFRKAKGKHADERLYALTLVLTPAREAVLPQRRER